MATYSLDEVRGVRRKHDAWWTVLLVDPVAVRVTRLLANRTSVTPDQVTAASLVVGLASAGCFAGATPYWLALGALAFHVGFVLECCDGRLARLTGTGTAFGPWLNHLVARVRALSCVVALFTGQYLRTGQAQYCYLGFMILFLDLFHALDDRHAETTRRVIRDRLGAAAVRAGAIGPGEDPWSLLSCRRERPRMVGGVEFQMALFVVAPPLGLIVPVAMAAGGLLVAFEFAAVHRLWLCARECDELVERFTWASERRTSAGVAARPRSDVGVR